jgi:hypothetical protein
LTDRATAALGFCRSGCTSSGTVQVERSLDGGATPPGTVSGCVCNTWARGDTRHCRLWQQQGKREAAYELLAQIYNWFTEGFDTADLQEAQALEELQG